MRTTMRRRLGGDRPQPLLVRWTYCLVVAVGLLNCILPPNNVCHGFHLPASRSPTTPSSSSPSAQRKRRTSLCATTDDDDEREQIEQARLGIWKSRRAQIRQMLKGAESFRNYRIDEGLVPKIDEETGKPVKGGDSKTAVTITAFAVAAGAVILRIGGRAALISAVGLDFLTDNPELQQQMTQVLGYAETVDPAVKAGLFWLAWTGVKVFCVDAAGVVLALSSGVLFGGVLEGTIMSALGATIGSSAAFGLAKADTPLRKKALEIVEDNPSLRGIDKVVTEDGLKAVLTLRLCPILPIPLGAYNYVYGTTNVKFLDFAGGIFLGSLKPYLLDSYLGYFGKQLVDGSAASQEGTLQDYALVAALGVSVLVGVFASQLASETFDAVLQEQEEEEKARKAKQREEGTIDDDEKVVTEIFGVELPEWAVKFQYALKEAEGRMTDLVLQEYDAKVWNETEELKFLGLYTVQNQTLTDDRNPAIVNPNSPEITQRYQDIDFGASTCDGIVLSPVLFAFFLQFSDPLFDEQEFENERKLEGKEKEKISSGLVSSETSASSPTNESTLRLASVAAAAMTAAVAATTLDPNDAMADTSSISEPAGNLEVRRGTLLNELQLLKDETTQRLEELDRKLETLDDKAEQQQQNG
mmetsp:Transcript_20729/g.49224  ORF Transcript_20729/g.49224 Transcript_20729/m.49224 type:complete len:641 (-) Transcript_20729:82-2004(-)